MPGKTHSPLSIYVLVIHSWKHNTDRHTLVFGWCQHQRGPLHLLICWSCGFGECWYVRMYIDHALCCLLQLTPRPPHHHQYSPVGQ